MCPTLILPCIESQQGLDQLDDIPAVAGLKGIFLGMGDLTRILGRPGNTRHPVIRDFFKNVMARAAKRNIMVFANVLPFPDSKEDNPLAVAGSARWFWDNGTAGVWISAPPAIIQRITDTLSDGGASWRNVKKASFLLHHEESLDMLRARFRAAVSADIPEPEYSFAGSRQGKRLEIEITARPRVG